MSSIVNLFTPSGGLDCDLYADTTTLALDAEGNERNFISIERNTVCVNTAVARVATIFESIENPEKASCSRGFEIKDIIRRMYGSNGYVCDDEDE